MGKKRNKGTRVKQDHIHNESATAESEGEDDRVNFAASLLASMGVKDNEKQATDVIPENSIEEDDGSEANDDFQVRHPHLSSIHQKFRRVFHRESENDSSDGSIKSQIAEESPAASTQEHNIRGSNSSNTGIASSHMANKSSNANETERMTQDGNSALQSRSDSVIEPAKGKRRNRRKEKIEQRERERVRMIQDASDEAKTDEDKRLIELKGMGMMISQAGLVEHEVQPDGHCLFHSLCDQLKVRKGVDVDVQTLRSILADFIRKNPDDFVPYLLDEETGELGNIEEYTRQLENTPLWGGDLEISATSRVYKTPVRIYFGSQMPLDVNEHLYPSVDPLHLAYYQAKFGLGAHYNSLRDGGKSTKVQN